MFSLLIHVAINRWICSFSLLPSTPSCACAAVYPFCLDGRLGGFWVFAMNKAVKIHVAVYIQEFLVVAYLLWDVYIGVPFGLTS